MWAFGNFKCYTFELQMRNMHFLQLWEKKFVNYENWRGQKKDF